MNLEEVNEILSHKDYYLVKKFLGYTENGQAKNALGLFFKNEEGFLIMNNSLLSNVCTINRNGDFICYDTDTVIYHLPNLKQVIQL